MKHFYLVVTLLFFSFSYAQDGTGNGEIEGFKLYPNPVTDGKVYISTLEMTPKQIAIYDVLGTEVLNTKISGTELLLNELGAGVYVLRVYQNNKVATRKLIVR